MATVLPLVTAERNAAKTQIQVARPPWLRNNLAEGEGEGPVKGMAKIKISTTDLVWIFTEKLKSFGDGAPAISIAIVPNKGGWTAIASRNDRNHHPRCAKRIEQVQKELREIYVLAKD